MDGVVGGEVRIRLLGAIEARDAADEALDLGPEKCRAVLAALALSVGEAVPVGRIIDLVWGAAPPRTAEKTLQSYVTRLRKGLGHDTITRTGTAYRLELSPAAVDVVRFQRCLAAAEPAAALEEWQGPPLTGLVDGGFGPVIDGLTEQWLGALESELTDQVDHNAGAAIGRLTELTADHPFREGLWALLMTALYRVGRQADALAAYGRARRQLVDHLGVEPGPRLRELEASILDQDERLGATQPPPGPAVVPPTGTVTLAFADVTGLVELWATHRNELNRALTWIEDRVRSTAEGLGGHVFNVSGESFGVAFDRPSEACRWAVELQTIVAEGTDTQAGGLGVRIGVNTGETEDRGPGYFGPAVNVAAALAAVGHPGQTLLSSTTAALLDDSTVLVPLGTYRLDQVLTDRRILQLGHGDHPPLRTEESRRGNLPRRLGPILGRDGDLEAIAAALVDTPVLTLIGPGGIGKTRLAVTAARVSQEDFPDGAWLVELAGIASSDDVPRAVAAVLETREDPTKGPVGSIAASLATRQSLIVLDNCEHVVDGAAELAAALQESCPRLRILVTSREGLGVPGEQLMVVRPLEPEGAGVDLFIERARAAAPSFDPADDRDRIAEICRRLDGVPLAIELAAARIKTLSPADLIDRLDDRLRLLSGGRRGSVERHRTLRATVQWSYDLLDPAEQVLFRRLSVFAGTFDLAAATQVADGPGAPIAAAVDGGVSAPEPGATPAHHRTDAFDHDVGDLLGGLVDRSMLIVESGPFGRRFRLLETMRQFGAECLSDAGNTDLIAARHAHWCLEEVQATGDGLRGQGEVAAVARLTELWPNLRAGFDWACAVGDRSLALALVRPIAPEILLRARTEIGDWLERLLEIPISADRTEGGQSDDEDLVPFALMWSAHRHTIEQNHDAFDRLVAHHGAADHPWVAYGRAFLYEDPDALATTWPAASALAEDRGDRYTAGLIRMGGRGQSLISWGRFDEVDAFANEERAHYEVNGPPTVLTFCIAMLAYSALLQGDEERAEVLFDEAAAIDTPDRTLGIDDAMQARSAIRRGRPEQAMEFLSQHIENLLDSRNFYMTKAAAVDFINALHAVGELDRAAQIRGYLSRPDLLDIELSRSLLDPTVADEPLDPEAERRGRLLNARTALEHMAEALVDRANSRGG
ncbi:MAG: BTAD domain-containing putative transcriptional regulator [Actinomycetota bacterium]